MRDKVNSRAGKDVMSVQHLVPRILSWSDKFVHPSIYKFGAWLLRKRVYQQKKKNKVNN